MPDPTYILFDASAPCAACNGAGTRFEADPQYPGRCSACCGTGWTPVALAEALGPLHERLEKLESVVRGLDRDILPLRKYRPLGR